MGPTVAVLVSPPLQFICLGWFCTRHNRHVAWPIIEEEAWDEDADDSLRLPCGFPDISSTLYYFDSGIKDVEGSTDDDTSESMVALPGGARFRFAHLFNDCLQMRSLRVLKNLSLCPPIKINHRPTTRGRFPNRKRSR